MEFTDFTLIVTEECNFDCSYCYQRKGKKYLDSPTLERAIDFFMPFFGDGCSINFTGGEPLLAFDHIQHAVNCIQAKDERLRRHLKFSLTTNGSILDDEILEFLQRHKFFLVLSFDGFAQDISRKKGSFKQSVSIIDRLLEIPDIELEVNSVFTPWTVEYLSDSIQFIIEKEIPNVSISLSQFVSWDMASLSRLKEEVASLRKSFQGLFQELGHVSLVNFRKKSKKGFFVCTGGRDRMALAPDGKLWGCHFFQDFFRGKEGTDNYYNYCFGDLNSFIESHPVIYPQILSNYSNLRMSHCYTSDTLCILCDELEGCGVCPIVNRYAGLSMEEIPSWVCEIKKIFRYEQGLFWQEWKVRKEQ